MPESATHASLVQAVIAYVEREFGDLADIAVREDAVRPLRGERPPRVEGYVPDVYATDVPTTTTIIGEAKTKRDLETEHSRRQISAFLSYLSNTPRGVFVLSVPWTAGAIARRLVAEINYPFKGAATRTVVLDGTGASKQ
ncbi:hypothetical protein [Mesorhizobium sp. M7A.F.Ca.US.010.02.1.1]|uniref:hypothetical protein n=1 Tax=Mesorhizobium sp. M7A.F.Ca.US.010.02.1.1 TaxID=2496743 RepID=UPI000FD5F3BF|nr:hypothetical protein [Mesorhizobium sp. M7A.F.Ca.US.010.02.1.1]RUW94395.1 hypothetical protein EOA19_03375 [Mesorhizobium sp. M7A.F.Ca.US.010.02.1.1]